jgi:hypothetical protein
MARTIPAKTPRPGDMVTPIFSSNGLGVWTAWGRAAEKEPAFHIQEGDLALVLEDVIEQGGNGSKILTSSGKTGWVNVNYITRI